VSRRWAGRGAGGPAGSRFLGRFWAIFVKEFIQMRRDRVTFAMMIGLPILQLILFGFAINTDPRHLPAVVQSSDTGALSRAVIAAMSNSSYFDFKGTVPGIAAGEDALRTGAADFFVAIPKDFEVDTVRGRSPTVLVAADASDPSAVAGAAAAIGGIIDTAMAQVLVGPLQPAAGPAPLYRVSLQRQYNPESRTSTYIVPGLLATILSMTMILLTAVAMVKESERGTMEMLLATPVRPPELMVGKIWPYVFVGYIQTGLFLLLARLVFEVPFEGSWLAFGLGFNLFIVVNLALGFLISTVARNQMQAMQLSYFMILPSILLSGFMFPFAGMPGWAQAIGSCVPATHFLRIVRKVMLKGASLPDIGGDMAALGVILVVITAAALLRYRQTLD
jgi:ABC-2 type transport system permease protein